MLLTVRGWAVPACATAALSTASRPVKVFRIENERRPPVRRRYQEGERWLSKESQW